jgi:hypothetical protein
MKALKIKKSMALNVAPSTNPKRDDYGNLLSGNETVETPVHLFWAETSLNIIRQPRQDGFDITEIDTILKISNAIESAIKKQQDNVYLEDKEYDYFLDKVLKFRWGIPDNAILEFVNDVRNAKTVDPNGIAGS